MKKTMPVFIPVMLFLLALAFVAGAQKKTKPWTEWSEKEVTKILNDSPWGQTQIDTNASEMFYSPTSPSGGRSVGVSGETNDRSQQGALNQVVQLNYRIRLLSAKPIRQAFARRVMLKNPEMLEQLKAFADQQSDKYIVVAVEYDGKDQRFTGRAFQAFSSTTTATLRNVTYLETKDGKRVFLEQYILPGKDGMGAKFVFPKMENGAPFVTSNSGFIRFYSEVSPEVKLNMRFKIADMIYEDKLEF